MSEDSLFWQERWARNYSYPSLNGRQALKEMDTTGQIRSAVLDVGCGPRSLSSSLSDSGYRIVGLDRGLPAEEIREKTWNRSLLLPCDVHRFVSPTAEEQALKVKIAAFMNPWSARLDISRGFVDFVIFGNVLNYLNYQSVTSTLSQWLKPGGMVFVHNEIDFGDAEFFSSNRPRSSEEVIGFIESLGLRLRDNLFEPKSLEPKELLAVFEKPC